MTTYVDDFAIDYDIRRVSTHTTPINDIKHALERVVQLMNEYDCHGIVSNFHLTHPEWQFYYLDVFQFWATGDITITFTCSEPDAIRDQLVEVKKALHTVKFYHLVDGIRQPFEV